MTVRFRSSVKALLFATLVMGLANQQAVAQSRFSLFGKKKAEQEAAKKKEAQRFQPRKTVLPPSVQSQASSNQTASGIDMTSAAPDGTVRLTNYSTPWLRVLEKVAKETGSTLIADRVPPGKYSRSDIRKYSRSDAVRILNQELAYLEFKILEQGKYLVLIHLPTTRPDYRRPVMPPTQQQSQYQQPPRVDSISQTGFRGNERRSTTITPPSTGRKPSDSRSPRTTNFTPAQGSQFQGNGSKGGFIQQLESGRQAQGRQQTQSRQQQPPRQQQQKPRSFTPFRQQQATLNQLAQNTPQEPLRFNGNRETPGLRQVPRPMQRSNQERNQIRSTGFFDEKTAKQETKAPAAPPKQVTQVFKPQNNQALALAKILYDIFSKLDPSRAEAVEDTASGIPEVRLYSEKPKKQGDPPRRKVLTIGVSKDNELIISGEEMEVAKIGRLFKLMDSKKQKEDDKTKVVPAGKDAEKTAKQIQEAINKAAATGDGKTAPPPTPEDPPNVQIDRKDERGNAQPALFGRIRSEVAIEAIEGLGVVITGNQSDVDAVIALINQIETLSAQTAPDIHVRLLDHVNSEALAELLTTVYEALNTARGQTARQSPPISIIAVGRPNAVLVLASPLDMESVNGLIDELDKPINPDTNFMVFPLKHTIAQQVQTMLEGFYEERGGLDTRAKIVTDVRTNSLIILARPNDLREIAKLIPEIDKQDSSAVAQVQIYELKHSAAAELSETINAILQSTLNPPTLGQGQLGQAFLGFGGGNSSQQLRDVRSVVLEYLVGEGEEQYKVRSGILSDVRITADARSNTLVVTSPIESIPIVSELISRLDRPATAVATIKHFTLKQADATSLSTLLNDLFTNQTTAGNTQVGVQLAGAEEANSVVPLRFSTDVRTNSIVAVGTAEALGVVEALIFRLDATDIRNRQTTIVRLKNSPAQNIADAVNAFLQSQTDLLQSQQDLISAFEVVEREVIIQAEPYTNSLLISATPQYFDQIKEMVMKLDMEQPQVVIQVMIVEVTLDNVDEFGVELGFQDPVLFDRSLTAANDLVTLAETMTAANGVQTTTQRIISQTATPGFPFNTPLLGNNTAANPARVATQGLSNFGVGRVNNDLGFGGLVVSAGSDTVNVLLRALQSRRNVEVLSRPQIRTLDNQPALIRVGQEVPRINGFTTAALGSIVPTVEVEPAGIILQVTPTISPDGNIRITITAEKSQFDPSNGVVIASDPINGDIISPVKDITQAETTVSVQDEQTIVLGGLITKSLDDTRRKVPWLSDIPIIGQAFQFQSKSTRRTELLMFLTPRVVKGNAYNEMLKQIESNRLHYTESDAEEIHGPIFGLPAETMNDSTGYPTAPAPGIRSNSEPLPLPAVENGIPMTRMPPRSDIRNVNYSTSARAQQGRSSNRSEGSSPRFKNQPNSIQQIGFEQPAGSNRVQVIQGALKGSGSAARQTGSQTINTTGRASLSRTAYKPTRQPQRFYQDR
jgi:general secretion pathway protein D